jgi:prefoldin subunit 5
MDLFGSELPSSRSIHDILTEILEMIHVLTAKIELIQQRLDTLNAALKESNG